MRQETESAVDLVEVVLEEGQGPGRLFRRLLLDPPNSDADGVAAIAGAAATEIRALLFRDFDGTLDVELVARRLGTAGASLYALEGRLQPVGVALAARRVLQDITNVLQLLAGCTSVAEAEKVTESPAWDALILSGLALEEAAELLRGERTAAPLVVARWEALLTFEPVDALNPVDLTRLLVTLVTAGGDPAQGEVGVTDGYAIVALRAPRLEARSTAA